MTVTAASVVTLGQQKCMKKNYSYGSERANKERRGHKLYCSVEEHTALSALALPAFSSWLVYHELYDLCGRKGCAQKEVLCIHCEI